MFILGASEYSHAVELAGAVKELVDLEGQVQLTFLQFMNE
jgi:hypothetical protein